MDVQRSLRTVIATGKVLVGADQTAKAVARGEAKNLQMMRDLLKKDVKFVEWDEDKQVFIRNLFKPFDVASIRMESVSSPIPGEMDADGQPMLKVKMRAIVEVEAKDKGKAIGKGGRNISSIRHIAKRHQEIDEVQVV